MEGYIPEKQKLMSDYFRRKRKLNFLFSNLLNLLKKKSRFKKIIKLNKINTLTIIILILCMRLFFYTFFKKNVLAQKKNFTQNEGCILIDPLKNIQNKTPNFSQKVTQLCQNELHKNKKTKKNILRKEKYTNLIQGYPMEVMIPAIIQQDEKVSAFLISIAKKESNWGLYVPKKRGKDCYNYWGYRGTYNQTSSGYSCFDNPEQAVAVVGKRIQNLIEKKINTPQKMVVWKCGSSCAGFSHQNVQKWISDVSLYYNKIVS